MISLEGIVTKCSLVRPKIIKSVHWNEKKSVFHFREYRDQTMTANAATSVGVYPQEDDDGNPVSIASIVGNEMLTDHSLLQNTAIARIVITKPFLFRKCQNVLQQVNYLVAWM
jgi:hypothetical protein